MEKLAEKVVFSFWKKYDSDHTVIRLATSRATTMEMINELCGILNADMLQSSLRS